MTEVVYWVNGEQESRLSAADRGIQYGDGLFETIRIRRARPEFLERHMKRLTVGCERLRLSALDHKTLLSEIRERAAQCEEGVLKLIVSRGIGNRGYAIPANPEPTRIVSIHPLPRWPHSHPDHGIQIRVCRTRLATQPLLAGIKHLNRLEQVLARAEWDSPAIQEGLMLDHHDRVIEGTMSNLFLIKDDALMTPDLSSCGVAGVLRSVILDRAKSLGMATEVAALTLDDVKTAQEVFLCNSVIGIWPVVGVDGIDHFDIGLRTRQLQSALKDSDIADQGNWYCS
ncbi:aminodeoxychorismate lyase [Thiogranum longum]